MRRLAAVLSRRSGAAAVAAVLALAAVLSAAGCAGAGPGTGGGPGEEAVLPDSAAGGDAPARRGAADRMVERGRELLEEGEAARSAAVLERAIRVDPGHGGAYLALARARLALGEVARARGLLDRAAELLRAEGSSAAARADSLRAALEEGG